MSMVSDSQIEALAESCVAEMRGVFRDGDPVGDAAGQFNGPQTVAIEAIKTTLRELAEHIGSSIVYPEGLRDEYATMVAEMPSDPSDQVIIAVLIEAAWTERGAREVLHVARTYGTSILSNALALAEAMDIEDGEAGL